MQSNMRKSRDLITFKCQGLARFSHEVDASMRLVALMGVTHDCCPPEVRAGNGICQAIGYHCGVHIVPLLDEADADEAGAGVDAPK
jgi:hypothetical protein